MKAQELIDECDDFNTDQLKKEVRDAEWLAEKKEALE